MPESGQSQGQIRSAAGSHNIWLVAIVVSMATFMEVLDTSIANVSLPHIAGGLAASQDESTWVLTSYLVSNAIILPVSGWLSRVIGRKRFYLICVAVFGISSLLCGLAPSLPILVLFRVLQGLGGGGLSPSEQSILADTFPQEKRGQAFALYGVAVVVAPTLGPTLGGLITDNISWRWIFFINVPVCIASLCLASMLLEDPPQVEKEHAEAKKAAGRVDWLGFLLAAIGLGCMQVVLDKGQEDDWFHSNLILAFSVVSAFAILFLIVWELNQDDPIVDLPLMKRSSFAAAMGVMFVTGFILISTTQMLPQYLQAVMGYNATMAGLALTAGGVATLCMMPLAGMLIGKGFSPKYLIMFGLLVETVGCFYYQGFNLEISFWHAAFGRVIQGVGLPFLFVPITTASYADLPPGKSNNASALINTMRNLGGSWGISIAVMIVARRAQFHHERLGEGVGALSRAFHSTAGVGVRITNSIVTRQASLLSYIDAFHMLAIACLVALPVALVLRKPRGGGEAAA
ncbi:MAG TPA: DHA2 family efflux MFS transporter permease subunit [Opitutaceae bacterium]|jgi:DHA2 family multidrug resistance protein